MNEPIKLTDGQIAAAIRETVGDLEALIAKAENVGLRVKVQQTTIALDPYPRATGFTVDIVRPI